MFSPEMHNMLADDHAVHANTIAAETSDKPQTITAAIALGISKGFSLQSLLTAALSGYLTGGLAGAIAAVMALILAPAKPS